MFIVIGPDDKAYGPFYDYMKAYDWAVIKWNGEMFSIYGVTPAE